MKKLKFPTELMYVFGLIFIALSAATMDHSNYGVSMIVGPAKVLSVKTGLTFGMTETLFQAILLVLMVIVTRQFKISYLFSFVTAFVYGRMLDIIIPLVNRIDASGTPVRLALYAFGLVIGAIGVACVIHTYIPGEVYELIAKEVPKRFGWNLTKFKTIYDVSSCLLAVVLSLVFFGKLEGIHWGTVACALINGVLIGRFCKLFDNRLELFDAAKKFLPKRN